MAHRHACTNLLKRPLLGIYDHLLRVQLLSSQCYGPVWLYGRHSTLLVLKYAAQRPKLFNYEHFVRAHGGNDCISFLWDAAKLFPCFYDRLRVRNGLSRYMLAHRLPTPSRMIILVPSPHWVALIRLWVKLCLQPCSGSLPIATAMLRSLTSVRAAPPNIDAPKTE